LSDALRGLVDSERRHHEALEQMNAHLQEAVAARTEELHSLLMRDMLTEGDELLRQFGARILGRIRKTDMAARLAGDEFVVILELLGDESDAANKADFLLGQLARPFILNSASVQVGASTDRDRPGVRRARRNALASQRRLRRAQTPQRMSLPWSRAARSISSRG
jgi:predicted signal transduction protein with EAL and GGDEF domain